MVLNLNNLYDRLKPKILSKNFKGNFVVLVIKKSKPRKWPDLYGEGGPTGGPKKDRSRGKGRKRKRGSAGDANSGDKKDRVQIKKFNSNSKSREHNPR